MKELRPMIHELFNALSIAQGMTEAVKESLDGSLELTHEKKLMKLEKSLKAMSRIEEIAHDMRNKIRQAQGEID